jgi:hypothetical protein
VDTAVLVINPLIYAEISIRYSSVEELEAALPIEAFRRDILPYEAAFLAGKRFLEYRKKRWNATVANARLLDRRPRRRAWLSVAHSRCRGYRTYFPTVELIAP